jgi:transcriptional regulator with XRE-family HTH domain
MIHRGEIVEKFVRKSGYSLSKLADKLHISRNTLYNKFGSANLSYRFIQEVGVIINYDFSFDFPEMPKDEQTTGKKSDMLRQIESKYSILLEKHIKLLEVLVNLANQTDNQSLKQEISKFMEEII